MNGYVVDASVGAKWFVEEEHSLAAQTVVQSGKILRVPDLFYPEIGNVLWKKVQRRELEASDAREAFACLIAFEGLQTTPSQMLTSYAMELALHHNCTVYDALYLSLAIHTESALVTADRKLVNNASNWFPKDQLIWIEDILLIVA